MSVAFYMDEQVPGAITSGLRIRGVDAVTVQEDSREEADDNDLLDRAEEFGRLMVTQDQDFLVIAAGRQAIGRPFIGIIFTHQQGPSVGHCVRDLEVIAKAGEIADYVNPVENLPL